MNQREPTSAPLSAGRAFPCLALLLLSLLGVARAWSRSAVHLQYVKVDVKPYLVALGAPPLRFLEPTPPPDLVTRPPASAPPQPASDAELAATTELPLSTSLPSAAVPSSASPDAALMPEQALVTAETETDQPTAPVVRTPPPILPDDLRPQARPEDFLPFFQIPISPHGEADVIVPIPRTPANAAPLPPSSATYTQTPR